MKLHAKLPLQQATLLVLQASDKVPSVAVNDQAVTSEARTLYGFLFQAVTVELTGDVTLRIT